MDFSLRFKKKKKKFFFLKRIKLVFLIKFYYIDFKSTYKYFIDIHTINMNFSVKFSIKTMLSRSWRYKYFKFIKEKKIFRIF